MVSLTEIYALPRMLRLRTAAIKMLSSLQSGTDDVVMLWKAEEILREAEVELRGEEAIRGALQIRTTQLEAENLELRSCVKQLEAQRDTAYGYGRDGGEPPWMK